MNDFDIKKVANALIFFIDKKVRFLTKTKFIKMMFFVDKLHLEKYGRSVFFDSYFKLPKGPVPSLTLNIINASAGNCDIEDDIDEFAKEFSSYIAAQCEYNRKRDKNMTIFSKKLDFNERMFSKSEIEALNIVADKYINTSIDDIIEATHNTKEFQTTRMQDIITKESMSGNNMEYVSFWEKELADINTIIN